MKKSQKKKGKKEKILDAFNRPVRHCDGRLRR